MENKVLENNTSNGHQCTVNQAASATVTQEQNVEQQNTSTQGTAVATAINGGCALAVQYSSQSNSNTQEGTAEASNQADNTNNGGPAYHLECLPSCPCCCDINQSAEASVSQAQQVSQSNINEQTTVVATADGEDSEAIAAQVNRQTNDNSQVGQASAMNSYGDGEPSNGNSTIAVKAEQSDGSEPVVQVKENKETTDAVEKKDKKDEILTALKKEVSNVIDKTMKIMLKVDKKSSVIEVNADENANVTVSKTKNELPDTGDVDVNAVQKGKGNVTVTISQNGKNLEIKADENGSIYVNGEKINS